MRAIRPGWRRGLLAPGRGGGGEGIEGSALGECAVEGIDGEDGARGKCGDDEEGGGEGCGGGEGFLGAFGGAFGGAADCVPQILLAPTC